MSVSSQRFVLTLYAGTDIRSHWLRLAVAEKKLDACILELPVEELPPDVVAQNPYGTLPVLTDREVCLHDARVALEYLEERYPQPALQPAGAVARARHRQLAGRVEREWCRPAEVILGSAASPAVDRVRKNLRDSLIAVSAAFNDTPFFLSAEFSLLDCMLAPVLWRLPQLDLVLPEKPCRGLLRYREQMVARSSFKASLRAPSPASGGRDMEVL